MPQSNILHVIFDLTTSKIVLELGDQTATGAGYVTITTPNNDTTAEITLASGSNNLTWSSYPEFTDTSGEHLLRGLWSFEWREGASDTTTDAGLVTVNFDAANFPASTIEGNVDNRDSIISSSISMTLDCFSSELSVIDSTNYTIIEASPSWSTPYSNTVYSPPNVSPLSTAITVQGTSVITPVYTGTYSSYLTGALSYSWESKDLILGNPITSVIIQDDDANIGVDDMSKFEVFSEIDGGTQFAIDCVSTSLCQIWECIDALNIRYMDLSCTNERLAKIEKDKLERAMQLITLSENALKCGDSDKATSYIDEIKTVTNCINCS